MGAAVAAAALLFECTDPSDGRKPPAGCTIKRACTDADAADESDAAVAVAANAACCESAIKCLRLANVNGTVVRAVRIDGSDVAIGNG